MSGQAVLKHTILAEMFERVPQTHNIDREVDRERMRRRPQETLEIRCQTLRRLTLRTQNHIKQKFHVI